jgi:hypothetical protein
MTKVISLDAWKKTKEIKEPPPHMTLAERIKQLKHSTEQLKRLYKELTKKP